MSTQIIRKAWHPLTCYETEGFKRHVPQTVPCPDHHQYANNYFVPMYNKRSFINTGKYNKLLT